MFNNLGDQILWHIVLKGHVHEGIPIRVDFDDDGSLLRRVVDALSLIADAPEDTSSLANDAVG